MRQRGDSEGAAGKCRRYPVPEGSRGGRVCSDTEEPGGSRHAGRGNATKIIVPSDIQGLASLATSLKEIMKRVGIHLEFRNREDAARWCIAAAAPSLWFHKEGFFLEPVIDLTKEYGIVLEGGGAKGAYQIGAWKALKEAGVRIKGVAGTSVGALNGAFICMDDIERAEYVWKHITNSSVMKVVMMRKCAA